MEALQMEQIVGQMKQLGPLTTQLVIHNAHPIRVQEVQTYTLLLVGYSIQLMLYLDKHII
jgi:hypothetical protein